MVSRGKVLVHLLRVGVDRVLTKDFIELYRIRLSTVDRGLLDCRRRAFGSKREFNPRGSCGKRVGDRMVSAALIGGRLVSDGAVRVSLRTVLDEHNLT